MPRVLVIEDDPFVRRLLDIHLANAGHQVTLARDPVEGLKAVLESLPDLILLDVEMPYMSGLDVLKALKSDENSRHIPVVMLTSRTDEAAVTAATRSGADAFLNKPIRFELIAETLNRLLPASQPGG